MFKLKQPLVKWMSQPESEQRRKCECGTQQRKTFKALGKQARTSNGILKERERQNHL